MFVFFGLVAVIGTTYVQAGRVTAASVVSGVCSRGASPARSWWPTTFATCPTDARSGKRTAAVYLGSRRTRILYLVLVTTAYALAIAIAVAGRAWAGLALLSAPLAVRAAAPVARRARGADLVPVLRDTAVTELVFAALLALGLAISGI